MKRSLLSFALALTVCLGLLPVPAQASGGGSCGDGVSWSFASGSLTVSGSGPMYDYASGSAPWYGIRTDITSIQVGGGVTSIGAYAFLDCLNAASVQLAGTVTSIGEHAFHGCQALAQAAVPGSVVKIGPSAFEGCSSLTGVTLPAGVDIGARAFHGLSAAAAVTYGGTQDQWDAIGAARNMTTADLVFAAGGGAVPTVQCQGTSPSQPLSLSLDSSQAGGDGVVELSAANPELTAHLTGPVGARFTSWELRLYTQSGSLITALTQSRSGSIDKSPTALSMALWKTPSGQSVSYSNFSLNLGTEYGYEFSAIVNGQSLITGRGRFRLGPVLRTYTVDFCNPIDMTYSKSIQVADGQPYGQLPTPNPMPGRVFEGWYTAEGARITSSTVAHLTQNQTLFARWSQEVPITLTLTNAPGNGGVVELSAQNSQLTAVLSAPSGKRLTRWDVNVYATNGTFVGRITDATGSVTGSTSTPLAAKLWTAGSALKAGQPVDFGTFQLTAGTVYDYEFTAVVEGQTYSSTRARFRLAASGQPVTVPAGGLAYTSTQIVMVDGRAMQFQMYALKDARGNDTNYIKLRDLAYVLNGTKAQFDVGWNGAVNVQTGRPYTAIGEEMHTPFSGNRAYEMAAAPTNVNGAPVSLTAILLKDDNGGGYTYYQLRDLGRALGFNVGWEAGKGIFVETGKPYSG